MAGSDGLIPGLAIPWGIVSRHAHPRRTRSRNDGSAFCDTSSSTGPSPATNGNTTGRFADRAFGTWSGSVGEFVSGGLVAVVFSDVVSSTELWSTLGDGLMVTFPTASESLDVFGFELTDDERSSIAEMGVSKSQFFDHATTRWRHASTASDSTEVRQAMERGIRASASGASNASADRLASSYHPDAASLSPSTSLSRPSCVATGPQ